MWNSWFSPIAEYKMLIYERQRRAEQEASEAKLRPPTRIQVRRHIFANNIRQTNPP